VAGIASPDSDSCIPPFCGAAPSGAESWMRGDNSLQADGFFPKTSILGRVERVERNGKRVYLGLGPERFLIAFLTRTNLLLPVLRPVWRVFRPVVRIFLK
jgi:hypothetical protein